MAERTDSKPITWGSAQRAIGLLVLVGGLIATCAVTVAQVADLKVTVAEHAKDIKTIGESLHSIAEGVAEMRGLMKGQRHPEGK